MIASSDTETPLLKSPVEFSIGSERISGEGEFSFRLSPVPHFIADISNLSVDHPFNALHLALASPMIGLRIASVDSEVNARIIQGSTAPLIRVRIMDPTVQLGSTAPTRVRASVLNFPSFVTPAGKESIYLNYVQLLEDEWKIELGSIPPTAHVLDDLKASGGFGITHQCLISRVDGQPVRLDAARSLLTALRYFLSFSAGRWIALPLAASTSDESECNWHLWDQSYCAPWNSAVRWFDWQHGDQLSGLFSGFWRRWQDPIWEGVLRRAIFWYISSNDSTGIDGSVILSQTALEFLAWFVLTEDRKCLSRRKFGDIRAAERIRLLLAEAGIPLLIPVHLPELLSFSQQDGPSALVKLRNSIVHPDSAQFVNPTSADTKYQAWQLAQWYIELLLLRECGYIGRYANRLRQGQSGELDSLPWVSADGTED